MKAEGEILHSKTHKLIRFLWIKKKVPHQWKEAIIVTILFRVIVIIIEESPSYEIHTKFYLTFF